MFFSKCHMCVLFRLCNGPCIEVADREGISSGVDDTLVVGHTQTTALSYLKKKRAFFFIFFFKL